MHKTMSGGDEREGEQRRPSYHSWPRHRHPRTFFGDFGSHQRLKAASSQFIACRPVVWLSIFILVLFIHYFFTDASERDKSSIRHALRRGAFFLGNRP